MKNSIQKVSVILMVSAMVSLAGCNFDGGPLIADQIDHKANVLTATQDSKPLSVLVREALRKNSQTAVSRIRVSQDSEDTVKLTGPVGNDAVRQEAERVAYQVEGVRYVVNNLNIQR